MAFLPQFVVKNILFAHWDSGVRRGCIILSFLFLFICEKVNFIYILHDVPAECITCNSPNKYPAHPPLGKGRHFNALALMAPVATELSTSRCSPWENPAEKYAIVLRLERIRNAKKSSLALGHARGVVDGGGILTFTFSKTLNKLPIRLVPFF